MDADLDAKMAELLSTRAADLDAPLAEALQAAQEANTTNPMVRAHATQHLWRGPPIPQELHTLPPTCTHSRLVGRPTSAVTC